MRLHTRSLARSSDDPRRRPQLLPLLLVSAALLGQLLLGPSTSASAAVSGNAYFVDCSRKAPGSGSQQAPWTSLSAVTAHGAFQPGDRISIRRGTTCMGRLDLTGSGTGSQPITLGTYGRGIRPLLAGRGTAAGTATVRLTDSSHWTIEDLRITNRPVSGRADTHRAGVLVVNRSAGRLAGITLQRLSVSQVVSYPWPTAGSFQHGFGGIAVITDSRAPNAGFDRVLIRNNRVDDVGRSGIITWNHQGQAETSYDTAVRISKNFVSHAAGDSILLGGARNSRIDHNIARDGVRLPSCPVAICPDTKGTASAGIWPIFSAGVRIDHNEASGMRLGPGDGEGFDVDASSRDVLFEYNYAHDNQGGGLLLCGSTNVTARFNIFENNRKSAIAFIGTMPAKNTQIYNNTIYASAKSHARPVRYFNGARGSGITFKNNIVYNYGLSSWAWPAKPKTAANTLIGLHGSGRPADAKTSYRSPGLKNPGTGRNGLKSLGGYKPAHPSTFPRGVPIPKSVTRDFFGKKINPAKPPRGAAG